MNCHSCRSGTWGSREVGAVDHVDVTVHVDCFTRAKFIKHLANGCVDAMTSDFVDRDHEVPCRGCILMHGRAVGEWCDPDLRDVPTCEALLDDSLQVLAPQALRTVSASIESRQSLLLDCLRSRRVLLVYDNL